MTWRAVSARPGGGAQGDLDVNLTLCMCGTRTLSKQSMLGRTEVDAGINAVIATAGRAFHFSLLTSHLGWRIPIPGPRNPPESTRIRPSTEPVRIQDPYL